MGSIDFTELARLSGEVLPQRTVLSTVTSFGDGGGGGSSSAAAAAAGGDGGAGRGSSILSACQANNTPSSGGLLGAIGIPAQNPSQNQSCIPAASNVF